jgi:hypothetical protein
MSDTPVRDEYAVEFDFDVRTLMNTIARTNSHRPPLVDSGYSAPSVSSMYGSTYAAITPAQHSPNDDVWGE